jgi:CRP-like cAMP-binding protein
MIFVINFEPYRYEMKIEQPECRHCSSKSASLFHYCHLQEMENIEQAKTCSLYKKGHAIFHEGASPAGLYCLNSGKVKLSKTATHGKEQIVRFAKPGDFLGYCSLLAGQPYAVSATAIEDAVVCMVPKDVFARLLDKNKQFSDNLVKLLCKTVTGSSQKMTDIAYKPVRGRMAEALLFLHAFYRDKKNPDGIITVTRDDLASFVGTVKETAIRTLAEFRNESLIDTGRSGIKVKSPQGLMKVSELYD